MSSSSKKDDSSAMKRLQTKTDFLLSHGDAQPKRGVQAKNALLARKTNFLLSQADHKPPSQLDKLSRISDRLANVSNMPTPTQSKPRNPSLKPAAASSSSLPTKSNEYLPTPLKPAAASSTSVTSKVDWLLHHDAHATTNAGPSPMAVKSQPIMPRPKKSPKSNNSNNNSVANRMDRLMAMDDKYHQENSVSGYRPPPSPPQKKAQTTTTKQKRSSVSKRQSKSPPPPSRKSASPTPSASPNVLAKKKKVALKKKKVTTRAPAKLSKKNSSKKMRSKTPTKKKKKRVTISANRSTPDNRTSKSRTLSTTNADEALYVSSSTKNIRRSSTMMQSSSISNNEKPVRRSLTLTEYDSKRSRGDGMHVRDYDSIGVLGQGAFGEVRLVRLRKTDEVFAMKIIRKSPLVQKNQMHHVMGERDALAHLNSPWIVHLYYAFQDNTNLYLVMEYSRGGNLQRILDDREKLTENEARVYIAEIAAATHDVHRGGFVHRDLKPDNVLLDENGHVKLSDFGLSKRLVSEELFKPKSDAHGRRTSLVDTSLAAAATFEASAETRLFSTVGTPDYIAPEVFGKGGYGKEVDWWSLGVMMFECLVGYPPFVARDPHQAYLKIKHHKKSLKIPSKISKPAAAVIKRLITDSSSRLTFKQLQQMEYFRQIDWGKIREQKVPFKPQISESTSDATQFPEFKRSPPTIVVNPLARDRSKGAFREFNFNHNIGGVPLPEESISESYGYYDDEEETKKQRKSRKIKEKLYGADNDVEKDKRASPDELLEKLNLQPGDDYDDDDDENSGEEEYDDDDDDEDDEEEDMSSQSYQD